jgi:3-isopropylmalate/(R)-2-methylmalate dehydratase small subunit
MDNPQRIRILGRAIPLHGNDIDTDRIIPARYLRTVVFDGLGDHVFQDDRAALAAKGQRHPFDEPAYQGAEILLVNQNFGCGSSREHAVWALADYGFRVVIAASFADIFANNSLKNGLLTVRLTDEQVAEIMRRAKETANYQLSIDLEKLRVEDNQSFAAAFTMDDFSRHCLLNGLDDIGLTLQHEAELAAYEAKHPVREEMRTLSSAIR